MKKVFVVLVLVVLGLAVYADDMSSNFLKEQNEYIKRAGDIGDFMKSIPPEVDREYIKANLGSIFYYRNEICEIMRWMVNRAEVLYNSFGVDLRDANHYTVLEGLEQYYYCLDHFIKFYNGDS